MAITNAAKNAMLDGLGAVALFVSLHDDDPGGSGASEFSGGSPAYARAAIAWDPAADGEMEAASQPTLNVPTGKTVKHVGLWTEQSGGSFLLAGAVTNEAFAAQGTYTVATGTIAFSET